MGVYSVTIDYIRSALTSDYHIFFHWLLGQSRFFTPARMTVTVPQSHVSVGDPRVSAMEARLESSRFPLVESRSTEKYFVNSWMQVQS